MRHRLRALALAGVTAFGGIAVVAVPAQGAGDGLWYYTDTGVADAHKAGVDGSGVTVAIIDSPISLKASELQGANVEPMEPSGCGTRDGSGTTPVVEDSWRARHGTEMAAYLVGNGKAANGSKGIRGVAPGAKVLYYASNYNEQRHQEGLTCYSENGVNVKNRLAELIERAIDDGAQIISISQAGYLLMVEDTTALARAYREGVIVVSGVDDHNILYSGIGYPAQANGVVAVSAVNPSVETVSAVRESVQLTVTAPGREVLVYSSFESGSSHKYSVYQGSSVATVWTAGVLALVWSKYPDAHANQILQTLIRNTGGKTHEPKFLDGFSGYGYVSVPAMLTDDPMKYEDGYNPLFVGTRDQKPSIEELAKAGVPMPPEYGGTPTPTVATVPATASPSPTPGPVDEGGIPVWLTITLAAVVVLAAAGITTAVVISRKRNRQQQVWLPQPPSAQQQ